MRFRIYGPTHGRGSWANVTRGIIGALDELGLLAGTFATDEGHEDDALPPAARAPIGLHIGRPAAASIMRSRGAHQERWAMIAPNSTWLPYDVAAQFAEVQHDGKPLVTRVVAPSSWGAEVLRTHFPQTPILVWRHGVTPADWHIRSYGDDVGRFHGLHLTSTWRDRKGTAPLIEAWSRVFGEDGLLTVVRNWQQEAGVRLADGVVGVPRLLGAIGRQYREHHMVVQPSRAEGFGSVPLEALCTGTPIVATACTGHADYMVPTPAGAVVVPHGELAPSDDGPGALAPAVSVDAIAEALVRARDEWPRLLVAAIESAPALAERWSWRRVTELALKE